MGDNSSTYRDVVRKRRQEQATALANSAGRTLQSLGTDILLRGKAAFIAAADAAVNPHERRARPSLSWPGKEKENEVQEKEQRVQSGAAAQAQPASRDRGLELSDRALISLLLATGVGAVFGICFADTHERTKERRKRRVARAGEVASGATKVVKAQLGHVWHIAEPVTEGIADHPLFSFLNKLQFAFRVSPWRLPSQEEQAQLAAPLFHERMASQVGVGSSSGGGSLAPSAAPPNSQQGPLPFPPPPALPQLQPTAASEAKRARAQAEAEALRIAADQARAEAIARARKRQEADAIRRRREQDALEAARLEELARAESAARAAELEARLRFEEAERARIAEEARLRATSNKRLYALQREAISQGGHQFGGPPSVGGSSAGEIYSHPVSPAESPPTSVNGSIGPGSYSRNHHNLAPATASAAPLPAAAAAYAAAVAAYAAPAGFSDPQPSSSASYAPSRALSQSAYPALSAAAAAGGSRAASLLAAAAVADGRPAGPGGFVVLPSSPPTPPQSVGSMSPPPSARSVEGLSASAAASARRADVDAGLLAARAKLAEQRAAAQAAAERRKGLAGSASPSRNSTAGPPTPASAPGPAANGGPYEAHKGAAASAQGPSGAVAPAAHRGYPPPRGIGSFSGSGASGRASPFENVPALSAARSGAVESLVSLLKDGDNDARRAALGTLLTLSCSSENRGPILEAGAMGPLQALSRSADKDVKQLATSCLKLL